MLGRRYLGTFGDALPGGFDGVYGRQREGERRGALLACGERHGDGFRSRRGHVERGHFGGGVVALRGRYDDVVGRGRQPLDGVGARLRGVGFGAFRENALGRRYFGALGDAPIGCLGRLGGNENEGECGGRASGLGERDGRNDRCGGHVDGCDFGGAALVPCGGVHGVFRTGREIPFGDGLGLGNVQRLALRQNLFSGRCGIPPPSSCGAATS